jgi:hypothetical protein
VPAKFAVTACLSGEGVVVAIEKQMGERSVDGLTNYGITCTEDNVECSI